MLQLGATLFTLLLFGLSKYLSATTCSGQVRALKDVARRRPSYIIKSSHEPAISDSTLPTGWYFAKDSGRYYTLVNGTAPEYVHCGTYNPIYIKDKLEKLDEGKEYRVNACLVDYDSDCKHTYSIKVRKCRQQIQYYLLPTDGTSAYCFEPSFSVEEPAPDYKIPGDIQVSVALMYRRKIDISGNSTEPELDFKCNFNSTAPSKTGSYGYYYGVSWVINGRLEKTFAPVMANDLDGTNLNETTIGGLGFKFGVTIQCAVRVSSTDTGNQTNPQMSDTFYAGIKVLTPQLTLNSGSSESIILQPTIPLGCGRPDALQYYNVTEQTCDLDIEMFDPNSKYSCEDTSLITFSNQKLCGSKITGWRNSTFRKCMHSHDVISCSYSSINSILPTISIQISVANDKLTYPDDKTFTMQLKTGYLTPHAFWRDVRLDDVTVLYTGGSQNNLWKEKKCAVVNDPYLVTFDGFDRFKHWPYESYINDSSHYLLYKNTKSLAEVQIKTELCDAESLNSYTSVCTCAAAIQAGGDVFLIDICKKIKRAEFIHCRGDVLNVRKVKDGKYEVYLPTGTKVTVEIGFYHTSNFLRIYIVPSPSDVYNTNGLCGNLDGNQESLNNEYYVKWKLQYSLFNTVLNNLPLTLTYEHNVCICSRAFKGTTSQNGHNDSTAAICFSQEYAACTEDIQISGEKKTCTLKYKRSVERHRRNIERLLVLSLSSENSNNRVRKSATISHLTVEQAYKECLDVFKSKPTYNMIHDLPAISLNDSISACVNDMMIDGRDFWKEESYNSLVSVVSQEIGRNGTLRKEKSEVVSNFKNLTCPSQCNFNGNCINGTCVCKDDYVGDSCFVNKSAPLEITDIEGGGECDLADGEDCHDCLQVHTKNLLKGFKCRIDTVDLDVNGTVIYSDVHNYKGEYESMFDGYCCPFAVKKRRKKRDVTSNTFTVRYSVSISNDGLHFGPSRDVHIFDSTCQSYVTIPTGDLIFSLKADTCFIESQCYREGDQSLESPILICCPFVTSYQWTDRQDCVPTNNPGNGGESSKLEIVAVSVSVSGILIVAGVVVLAIWTYKSKKRFVWNVSKAKEEPPKCPDYTELDFSSLKFESGGKVEFIPRQLNVSTTDYSDYEQLRK